MNNKWKNTLEGIDMEEIQRDIFRRSKIEDGEFSEIAQTASATEANQMLKQGYVLLETAGGKEESGEPYILYALGKVKNDDYSPTDF